LFPLVAICGVGKRTGDSFTDLEKISSERFIGNCSPITFNAYLQEREIPKSPYAVISEFSETFGDSYLLEMHQFDMGTKKMIKNPDKSKDAGNFIEVPSSEPKLIKDRLGVRILSANPEYILAYIRLSPELTEDEIKRRKAFYLTKLSNLKLYFLQRNR